MHLLALGLVVCCALLSPVASAPSHDGLPAAPLAQVVQCPHGPAPSTQHLVLGCLTPPLERQEYSLFSDEVCQETGAIQRRTGVHVGVRVYYSEDREMFAAAVDGMVADAVDAVLVAPFAGRYAPVLADLSFTVFDAVFRPRLQPPGVAASPSLPNRSDTASSTAPVRAALVQPPPARGPTVAPGCQHPPEDVPSGSGAVPPPDSIAMAACGMAPQETALGTRFAGLSALPDPLGPPRVRDEAPGLPRCASCSAGPEGAKGGDVGSKWRAQQSTEDSALYDPNATAVQPVACAQVSDPADVYIDVALLISPLGNATFAQFAEDICTETGAIRQATGVGVNVTLYYADHADGAVEALQDMIRDGADTLIVTNFAGPYGPALTELSLAFLDGLFHKSNPRRLSPILTISHATMAEQFGEADSVDWFIPFNSRQAQMDAIYGLCKEVKWPNVVVWADNVRIRDDVSTPWCNLTTVKTFCVAKTVEVFPTLDYDVKVRMLLDSVAEGWQVPPSLPQHMRHEIAVRRRGGMGGGRYWDGVGADYLMYS